MNSLSILNLVEKFSVEKIENSLIYLYLEQIGAHNIKNELIKNRLKEINPQATHHISDFIKKEGIDLTLKNIEKIFELLIEKKDKQINGAVYTPEFIAKLINDEVIKVGNDNFKVCDCSCGSGAFLVLATEKISNGNKKSLIKTLEENIYGVDIMPESVERTKIILSLLAIENKEDKENINFNIKCGDSLNDKNFDWKREFPEVFNDGGFDAVIGNPPYVRIQDFDNNLKDILIDKFQTIKQGNFNLYFAFFELGMNILKITGKLGYITPNNYFTSLSGRELREYMQNNRLIKKIINFNHLRIFEEATTYTCLTFLDKSEKDSFEFASIDDKDQLNYLNKIDFSLIEFKDLDLNKWRLMNKIDYENIRIIEKIGVPLGEFADIKVGIATLKDALFFVEGSKREENYFIKNYEGKNYKIEEGITRKITKIASVDSEEEIKRDTLRIIFPYIKKEKGYGILNENELKNNFPKCYEYLLSVKDELSKRDKGKAKIPAWYAYGRSQGLSLYGKKLLTKTFSNRPNFMLDEDEYSLFCNGYAVFTKDDLSLNILRKILNSKIMDYYTKKTSIEIEGDYQCYQKNFIQTFSIPLLDENKRNHLLKLDNREEIDKFLIKIYGLSSSKDLDR